MSCPIWRDIAPGGNPGLCGESWTDAAPYFRRRRGKAYLLHVEWRMKGYFIKVASTEEKKIGELIFADKRNLKGNILFLPLFQLTESILRRTFR